MQPGDKGDDLPPDAIAILDAVIDHVAEEEAENGEPTEQDIHWSREVRRQIQARIAVLRGQLTPVEPIEPAAPMDDGTHAHRALRALDREALLARLETLHPPGAHPDLASLSDDDLRRMLARLTRPTGGGTP